MAIGDMIGRVGSALPSAARATELAGKSAKVGAGFCLSYVSLAIGGSLILPAIACDVASNAGLYYFESLEGKATQERDVKSFTEGVLTLSGHGFLSGLAYASEAYSGEA